MYIGHVHKERDNPGKGGKLQGQHSQPVVEQWIATAVLKMTLYSSDFQPLCCVATGVL